MKSNQIKSNQIRSDQIRSNQIKSKEYFDYSTVARYCNEQVNYDFDWWYRIDLTRPELSSIMFCLLCLF